MQVYFAFVEDYAANSLEAPTHKVDPVIPEVAQMPLGGASAEE